MASHGRARNRGVSVQLAGAVGFGALVLLNVGGYRYGVSDQAFYIPVVMHELTPTLFPHDAPLIAAQDRFFAFDDWFAPLLAVTGLTLSSAFLSAYGVTLLVLYSALTGLGRVFYTSGWAVAGLVIGLTMRHRIPDTAVNSLEGYFHPRLLAFSLGLWAVVWCLRGRSWHALLILVSTALVHPTTALWFVVLVGSAALVSDRKERPRLLVIAGAAVFIALYLLAGPLGGRLVAMDPVWVDVLAIKDYLDPVDWPWSSWVANLGLGGVIAGIFFYRRRLGLVSQSETGVVIGCAVLVCMFLVSVPLSHAQIALVVQLQTSRIFWLLDVLASVYMGWLLIDSPLWSASLARASSRLSLSGLGTSPRWGVVVILVVLAVSRGVYVTFIVPAGRPITADQEVVDDWGSVMEWAGRQPVGTHFLADPGHANLYGSSVRVASGRDVYLEIVKDVGMAIYSADIAHRVQRRIDDLGHFATLSPERARSLARDYDLDFLVTEQDMALPEATRSGRFRAYDLSVVDPGLRRDRLGPRTP